jgi:hypothetical protein
VAGAAIRLLPPARGTYPASQPVSSADVSTAHRTSTFDTPSPQHSCTSCGPSTCAGLWDLELDIDYLTAVKDDQELRLEKGSEALRTIKGQNEQVNGPYHAPNSPVAPARSQMPCVVLHIAPM